MLSVLYLYDNNLSALKVCAHSRHLINVQGLSNCLFLTRLHLANNNISDIGDSFRGLDNLQYLNLRSNLIQTVGGLEDLYNLQVLHLDKQMIPNNVQVSFQEASLATLSVI